MRVGHSLYIMDRNFYYPDILSKIIPDILRIYSDIINCFIIGHIYVCFTRTNVYVMKYKLCINKYLTQNYFKLLGTILMATNYYLYSTFLSGYPDSTDICFSCNIYQELIESGRRGSM